METKHSIKKIIWRHCRRRTVRLLRPFSSNDHLRGPVTLTSIAKRLAVATWFYNLGLPQLGFEHPTFRLRGKRSNPLRHHRGSNNINAYIIHTKIKYKMI